MTDSLENEIRENASAPAEASVDGQSVKQHSLRDQINVDRYLASKRASRSKGFGLKLAKISPGGTV